MPTPRTTSTRRSSRTSAAGDKLLLASAADLEGRELEIFSDRLMSEEPVTLQELGDRWGVSRERARQVEKRMILRLRGYLAGRSSETPSRSRWGTSCERHARARRHAAGEP
jgi:DNA-directed RNA polymerase sigma subunit (sigma70/sigma32)